MDFDKHGLGNQVACTSVGYSRVCTSTSMYLFNKTECQIEVAVIWKLALWLLVNVPF